MLCLFQQPAQTACQREVSREQGPGRCLQSCRSTLGHHHKATKLATFERLQKDSDLIDIPDWTGWRMDKKTLHEGLFGTNKKPIMATGVNI